MCNIYCYDAVWKKLFWQTENLKEYLKRAELCILPELRKRIYIGIHGLALPTGIEILTDNAERSAL